MTFHYKTDPKSVRQYGLIAEEVVRIYPELVIRDDSGKIQGVRYEELAPMLLREIQQQQRINAAQADRNSAQAEKYAEQAAMIAALGAEIRELKQRRDDMQEQLAELVSGAKMQRRAMPSLPEHLRTSAE